VLERLGAIVSGISLPPHTSPSLFDLVQRKAGLNSHICDIRELSQLREKINFVNPQVLFHLAAQPLVRRSYTDPLETYSTNVLGTVNVLEALRSSGSVRVAIFITTDKVYRVQKEPKPFQETDALGGYDPYSASKAASELIIESYRDAFFTELGVSIATARAGNVIGGGDWSEDRIIPDAIRAWVGGQALRVRRPQAVRPWQHVLEALYGYLTLAELLWRDPTLAGAYNFGPETHEFATVKKVVDLAKTAYGRGDIEYETADSGPHETHLLTLDTTKASTVLNLKPVWALEEAISRTMIWYRRQEDGAEAVSLCFADISDYEREAAILFNN